MVEGAVGGGMVGGIACTFVSVLPSGGSAWPSEEAADQHSQAEGEM